MAPTRPAENAAPRVEGEAEGALRLLRDHVELRQDRQLLPQGSPCVACGACASLATTDALVADAEDTGALPAPCSPHRAPVRHLANLFVEEPDAWKSACPDPWGPGEPKSPGYPTVATQPIKPGGSVLARRRSRFSV